MRIDWSQDVHSSQTKTTLAGNRQDGERMVMRIIISKSYDFILRISLSAAAALAEGFIMKVSTVITK